MFSIAFSKVSRGSLPVFSLNHGESLVNDLLSDALLAIQHHAVDQTGDHLGIVIGSAKTSRLAMLPLLGIFLPPSQNDIIGTRK